MVAPPRDVVPLGVEQSDCEAVGTGLVGSTSFAGHGRVGISSFSSETGELSRSLNHLRVCSLPVAAALFMADATAWTTQAA